MQLHKQTTKKLFYGQWPYKLTCRIEGITLTRYNSIDNIINGKLHYRYKSSNIQFNQQKLTNFLLLAQKYFDNDNIKIRIENTKISFYILTKNEHAEMLNNLYEYAIESIEPENETELKKLQSEKNYIICKEIPHKKYKFKVVFKDMPLNIRQNLINWAEKYNNNEIYITPSTRTHFKGGKYKYGTHYFFINDKRMLTFINLAASGYVRRVDEYITQEEI